MADTKQALKNARSAVTKTANKVTASLSQGETDPLDYLVNKLREKADILELAATAHIATLNKSKDIELETIKQEEASRAANVLMEQAYRALQSEEDESEEDESEEDESEEDESPHNAPPPVTPRHVTSRHVTPRYVTPRVVAARRDTPSRKAPLPMRTVASPHSAPQPEKRPQQAPMDAKAIAIRMRKIKLQAQNELNDLKIMKLDQGILDPEDEDEADRGSTSALSSAVSESSTILQQQKQLLDLLAAPKLEIPVFDGSPLQYYQFIRAFQDNVERFVPEHSSRLARLLQYCTGPAKTLIQCCAMMPPSQGYTRALELLKDRFGNEFLISRAFIDLVTTGSAIKGERHLRAFSDDLRNTYETLKAMQCLGEINAQGNLLSIVSKLPAYLQNRWRREVHLIRKQKRLPNLEDLVTFIEDAAEEANDPVFGSLTAHPDKNPVKQKISTFATEAEEDKPKRDPKCANCSEMHPIYKCKQFLEASVDERNQLVQEKRLCYNCLRANHAASNCESNFRCMVCRGKHHTSLHHDKPVSTTNGYVRKTVNGAGHNKIALPVVAVKVKSPHSARTVDTYALLDPGSTASFATEALIKELGITGKPRQVTLTTLENEDVESWTTSCSLSVSDTYGSESIELPTVYTRSSLPIRKGNVATMADLSRWPHLRGINLPTATAAEVTLLIGQDSPESLTPMTIIPGRTGEPYAILTRLGWALNGPLGGSDTETRNITSSFITLEEQASDERTVRTLTKPINANVNGKTTPTQEDTRNTLPSSGAAVAVRSVATNTTRMRTIATQTTTAAAPSFTRNYKSRTSSNRLNATNKVSGIYSTPTTHTKRTRNATSTTGTTSTGYASYTSPAHPSKQTRPTEGRVIYAAADTASATELITQPKRQSTTTNRNTPTTNRNAPSSVCGDAARKTPHVNSSHDQLHPNPAHCYRPHHLHLLPLQTHRKSIADSGKRRRRHQKQNDSKPQNESKLQNKSKPRV